MPFCSECGGQVGDTARFCPACGAATSQQHARGEIPLGGPESPGAHVMPPAAKLSSTFIGGQIAAAFGSLLVFIGPFMPWATAFIVSASGLQKTGNEALMLVFGGLIGMGMTVVGLTLKKHWTVQVQLAVGVLSLALSIFYLVQLYDSLSELDGVDSMVSIGGGIYLCVIGSVVMVAGAVFGMMGKKKSDRGH